MSKLYTNKLRLGTMVPMFAKTSSTNYGRAYVGDDIVLDYYEEVTPEIDYSHEYFQVLSWKDNNTFTLQNDKRYTLYYSIDKTNWSSTTGSLTYTLSKGQRLYWKANLSNSPLSNSNNDSPATTFKCSETFEICGNICSLFYGDNFIGKTDYNGCYYIRVIANNSTALVSIRNLILPSTNYSSYNYRWFGGSAQNLLYGIKELPAGTTSFGQWPLTSFYEGCSKIQETPVMRFSDTDIYQMIYNSGVKRMIWLGPSGYPSNMGTPAAGGNFIRYKLSTNTSVSGSQYRDFDTLEAQDALLSIWAETETPYDGIVAGCSDYFIAGDSVTLEYIAVNGTFNGYYDENDNLLSSSSTYTFTAQRSMKIKVKTT